MKPLFRTLAIAAIAALLTAVPADMDAQRRSSRGSTPSSQSSPSRSGNSGSRSGSGSSSGSYRPGGSSSAGRRESASAGRRESASAAPDRNGGKQDRPGGSQATRPGGNDNRPGGGNNGGNPPRRDYSPGHPERPGHGGHGGHAAAPPRRHDSPAMRPYRPAPAHHNWRRPVPPPHWHPYPSAPRLSTILGITFGTALNISVNALISSGYYVDGYASDIVYLRDVNSYGYLWPYATMYYEGPGMNRSEFLYSTVYSDPMRYYSLYNNFTGVYGPPVDIVNTGALLAATWFAPNQGYITLQYAQRLANSGQMRFFTTLTLGL